jgi:uncharacterized protein YuzE
MVNLDFLYDSEGDILYISFTKDRKGTTLSLNDYVVLVFDMETGQAKGLTIMNYAYLVQNNLVLPLTRLEEFPPDIRSVVWNILKNSPVNKYLRVEDHLSIALVEQFALPDLLLVA